MPKNLTTPPDVDRSHIPLGPYTVDFSGLIGGPTGKGIVTFYVVMQAGDVHFQKVGEVGKKLELEGAGAVTGLSVSAQVPQLAAHGWRHQAAWGVVLRRLARPFPTSVVVPRFNI